MALKGVQEELLDNEDSNIEELDDLFDGLSSISDD